MLENLRPLFERERCWPLSNFSVFTFQCVHKTNEYTFHALSFAISLSLSLILNIYFISSFYRKISINILNRVRTLIFSEFLKFECRSSEGRKPVTKNTNIWNNRDTVMWYQCPDSSLIRLTAIWKKNEIRYEGEKDTQGKGKINLKRATMYEPVHK